jgi:hypothetical protein
MENTDVKMSQLSTLGRVRLLVTVVNFQPARPAMLPPSQVRRCTDTRCLLPYVKVFASRTSKLPMKITPSERNTLLGPTIVGILVGAVSAFCVVAFDSEYGGAIQLWQKVLRAMLGLFGGFLVAFGAFGLLPLLVARVIRRNRSG